MPETNEILESLVKEMQYLSLVLVAHAYNPSYLRG
jgi:hypothetical protein